MDKFVNWKGLITLHHTRHVDCSKTCNFSIVINETLSPYSVSIFVEIRYILMVCISKQGEEIIAHLIITSNTTLPEMGPEQMSTNPHHSVQDVDQPVTGLCSGCSIRRWKQFQLFARRNWFDYFFTLAS